MKKGERGFTLAEFVIGLAASAAVVLAAVMLLAPARNWILTDTVRSGYSGAEKAVMQMVMEIRRIKNPEGITTFTASHLQFTNFDDKSINFQYSGPNITRNGDILVRNVSSFSFTYLDKDGSVTAVAGNIRTIVVSIAVTSGSYTIRLESAGSLRNLT